MWGLVDFPNLCISQTSNWALVDGKTRWRGGSPVRGDGAWARRPDRVCVCVCVCVWSLRVISNPREGLSRNNDNDNNRETMIMIIT